MAKQEKGWEMHITEMDLFTGLSLKSFRRCFSGICGRGSIRAGKFIGHQ